MAGLLAMLTVLGCVGVAGATENVREAAIAGTWYPDRPTLVAVEIDDKRLCFETLVRSSTNLHCTCIAYATPSQRQFVLDFIDKMLAEEVEEREGSVELTSPPRITRPAETSPRDPSRLRKSSG